MKGFAIILSLLFLAQGVIAEDLQPWRDRFESANDLDISGLYAQYGEKEICLATSNNSLPGEWWGMIHLDIQRNKNRGSALYCPRPNDRTMEAVIDFREKFSLDAEANQTSRIGRRAHRFPTPYPDWDHRKMPFFETFKRVGDTLYVKITRKNKEKQIEEVGYFEADLKKDLYDCPE